MEVFSATKEMHCYVMCDTRISSLIEYRGSCIMSGAEVKIDMVKYRFCGWIGNVLLLHAHTYSYSRMYTYTC